MEINLLIHMEVVADDKGEPKVVFWARSDDAPDFYSAADHLKELLLLSEEALKEELDEPPTIISHFVKPETTQGPPARQQQVTGMDTPLTGKTLAPSDSMSRILTGV